MQETILVDELGRIELSIDIRKALGIKEKDVIIPIQGIV